MRGVVASRATKLSILGSDSKLNVLICAIRNTTHSVALVNQFQLIALGEQQERCQVFHEDVQHQWGVINPGFREADARLIASYRAPQPDQHFDAVYTMAAPHATYSCRRRFGFFVTEFGSAAQCAGLDDYMKSGAYVITPSRWSKARICNYTDNSDSILVVPHGVNENYFRPISNESRAVIKRNLGLGSDAFIFLNVGAMTWNKGIDTLLLAFQAVASRYDHVRLVLKDASTLYGTTAHSTIKLLLDSGRLAESTLARIIMISETLNFEQLSHLYNISDCYVAPYRAEGFNIPVLEAIACQTPVIVPKGGATDDFANERVATSVDASFGYCSAANGYCLEPELDSLVAAMTAAAEKQPKKSVEFMDAAAALAHEYSYRNIAERLVHLWSNPLDS